MTWAAYAVQASVTGAAPFLRTNPQTLGFRVNVALTARGYDGGRFQVYAELHDARNGMRVTQVGGGPDSHVVYFSHRTIRPGADRVSRVPGVWVEQPVRPGRYLFRIAVSDSNVQRLAEKDSTPFTVDRQGAVRIARLCTPT